MSVADGLIVSYFEDMVASLQATRSEKAAFGRLLEPDILSDGAEPEQRVVYSGISWERYLAVDKVRGEDVSFPRLYYLDGDLEIMSTSDEHERIKKMLGDFVAIYFDEANVEVVPRGQATMWRELKKAGAEPDESWCLETAKKFPDIVVEIALTSGGVSKLKLYRRFQIPEVWIWRNGALEFYLLNKSDEYKKVTRSKLLPGFDPALLYRCMGISSWLEARRTYRAAVAKSLRAHGR